jgi:DNA-binding beta-propeller fold protein YncE
VIAGGPGAVPGGCVRDASHQSATERLCAIPATGLLGATGIAASPDGRNVYVVSLDSDAVVALARTSNGRLHPIVEPSQRSCVQAPDRGPCATHAAGLGGVDAVAVSRDGRNVYAGSLDSAAVVAFSRSAGGLLRPVSGRGGCVQGVPVAPGAGGRCAQSDGALEGVTSLAISPDGRFVYALSSASVAGGDSLVTLRRDPHSGALSPVPDKHGGCVVPLGSRTCRIHAAGLRGASGIAISPDGRNAYVTGQFSSAVIALSRNRYTGTLMPLHGVGGCVEDSVALPAGGDARCAIAAPGLGGARALTVSADERFVYVAAFDPGGVAVLARNPATGALAAPTGPGGCLTPTGSDPPPGCAAVDGLRGATAIALAPSGRAIYVATTTGNSVLRIDRDPVSGQLGAAGPPHPVSGLNAPSGMALTRDGRNLYLASPIDATLLSLTAG